RVRGRARHHAARAADQARRVGGALGAPHRPALADKLPLAPNVAPARARGRRDHLRPSGKLVRRVTARSVSLSAAPWESAPTRRWAIRPYLSRRRAEIDCRSENGSLRPVGDSLRSWMCTFMNEAG